VSVLSAALPPALAGWRAPTDDADALRVLAGQVDEAGHAHETCARLLRHAIAQLLLVWRGTAADAARAALEQLVRRALDAAASHAAAADVLRVCAARGAEAQVLWAQAQEAERLDLEERAAREHAALAGALVGPYEVDGSPLRRHARHLASQACSLAQAAHEQAAAQLRDLAPTAPVRPHALGPGDHVRGAGSAAVEAVWGSAVLAAELSLPRLVADRHGWLSDVLSLRNGLRYAQEHPGEAVRAAAGWDLLASGRYGEWAGGLAPDLLSGVLTGGALPVTRRAAGLGRQLADLAEDVDDLERLDGRGVFYSPVAGGAVRPAPDAVMTPRYPTAIRELTPERQTHILDGDPPPRTGGGHRPGTGKPGKSEFPASWSDDDIIRRVMETARHPERTVEQKGRNVLARATYDGVEVQVVVHPEGRIITAYPLSGPGVVKNPPQARTPAS
jgi:hypothetical protein